MNATTAPETEAGPDSGADFETGRDLETESDITVEAEPVRPPPRGSGSGLMRPGAPRLLTPGYSRFVQTMKLALPLVAAVLVGMVVIWPHLRTTDDRFRIGFSALKAPDAEDPSMINARYVGSDDYNRPFSVTADLARNLDGAEGLGDGGPGALELEMPKADITLEDGTWLVLTADTGIYRAKQKRLELVGGVDLFHDQGYEVRTSRADVDFNKGIASGNEPVEGQGPFGSLKAEGFQVLNSGTAIHFSGRARLTINPNFGETQ